MFHVSFGFGYGSYYPVGYGGYSALPYLASYLGAARCYGGFPYGGYSYPGFGHYSYPARYVSTFFSYGAPGCGSATWMGPAGFGYYMGYGNYGYDPDYYGSHERREEPPERHSSYHPVDHGGSSYTHEAKEHEVEEEPAEDPPTPPGPPPPPPPTQENSDASETPPAWEENQQVLAFKKFIDDGKNGLGAVRLDRAAKQIVLAPQARFGDVVGNVAARLEYAAVLHKFFSDSANKDRFMQLVAALPDGTTLVLEHQKVWVTNLKSAKFDSLYASLEGWNPANPAASGYAVTDYSPAVRYFAEKFAGDGKAINKPVMNVAKGADGTYIINVTYHPDLNSSLAGVDKKIVQQFLVDVKRLYGVEKIKFTVFGEDLEIKKVGSKTADSLITLVSRKLKPPPSPPTAVPEEVEPPVPPPAADPPPPTEPASAGASASVTSPAPPPPAPATPGGEAPAATAAAASLVVPISAGGPTEIRLGGTTFKRVDEIRPEIQGKVAKKNHVFVMLSSDATPEQVEVELAKFTGAGNVEEAWTYVEYEENGKRHKILFECGKNETDNNVMVIGSFGSALLKDANKKVLAISVYHTHPSLEDTEGGVTFYPPSPEDITMAMEGSYDWKKELKYAGTLDYRAVTSYGVFRFECTKQCIADAKKLRQYKDQALSKGNGIMTMPPTGYAKSLAIKDVLISDFRYFRPEMEAVVDLWFQTKVAYTPILQLYREYGRNWRAIPDDELASISADFEDKKRLFYRAVDAARAAGVDNGLLKNFVEVIDEKKVGLANRRSPKPA